MRSVTLLALSAVAVVAGSSSFACSRPCAVSYDSTPNVNTVGKAPPAGSDGPLTGTGSTTTPADASRLISEADIVQLDHEQNFVYAMSRSGSLAIVDASKPGTLSLLGKTTLSGQPFEMYRRGDVLLTMSNAGAGAAGNVYAPNNGTAPIAADATSSALITAVDVANPSALRALKTINVPGEIADSRIVGNILYLATFENGQCYGCATQARTLVTTFDIADPLAPKQVDQVTFASPEGTSFWPTPWKRSIVATKDRLYVGGLAASSTAFTNEGIIEVLDITDPAGHLVHGATITTSGPVLSRWQMDESNGYLRVISQRGAGRTTNGESYPDIDTFRIESTSSFLRAGHTTMTLPRQEGLKTVRFDGARAYAITFFQGDPLFTIDLSDPAKPAQKGELQIPGWVYHLEPKGDRLIGLGLDRNDSNGNLNVSLFDVSSLDSPHLLGRSSFGPKNLYNDALITNGALAEDQDRIQKAFRVFDDGLIAIPYTGGNAYAGDSCTGASGVQLLEWTRDSLTKRALLPVNGNPRRAIRRDSDNLQELIAVSDSNVTSFTITDRTKTPQSADVVIGSCVPRTLPQGAIGGGRLPGGNDYPSGGYDGTWGGDTCR
jgi:hypothetical protein